MKSLPPKVAIIILKHFNFFIYTYSNILNFIKKHKWSFKHIFLQFFFSSYCLALAPLPLNFLPSKVIHLNNLVCPLSYFFPFACNSTINQIFTCMTSKIHIHRFLSLFYKNLILYTLFNNFRFLIIIFLLLEIRPGHLT